MKVFVTGTDTGVGKTEFSSALLRYLSAQREGRTLGLKPFESGVGVGDDDDSDAKRLAESAGHEPLCMASFKLPAAPWIAAKAEGRELDLDASLKWIQDTSASAQNVVCEGAGGWRVPITESECISDVATALGWPVIIVAKNQLGTVNHTLLTLEAVLAVNAKACIVFNQYGEGSSSEASLRQIGAYSKAPVWTFSKEGSETFSYSKLVDWAKSS